MIIDLDKSINTSSFKDDNIVHQAELERVEAIVQQLLKAGCYTPSKEGPIRRVHNTITLTGGRGSGKTSFLYTIEKKFKEEFKNIEILDLVDPTLIEEKGHIFLNIVARIKERVGEVISAKPGILEDKKYLEWDKNLNRLAAGLPMLDGINGGLDPSDWNDTTFVMRDGLRRVAGANNLEKYFHVFIKQSLDLLSTEEPEERKKYFLIAFDDVDTDFAKGWPVLETLRKYLTSPQLITFLSGDLDLYSFVVRKKQWDNFGKGLLRNEFDKRGLHFKSYPELVEKLESQYMMKLLKPEYRITLSTLAAKLATKKIEISVGNDSSHIPLVDKYKSHLRDSWSISGENMQNVYINFFTNLPLRTQISLLRAFGMAEKPGLQKIEKLHQLAVTLTDIFHSELRTANIDAWEFINGYGKTNIYLLNFLMENHILDEGSQFFPKLNNPSLDGAVVALGSVLSERMTADPYEIFDHIIRVSNIVAKATVWPAESGRNGEEDEHDLPNVADLVFHSRSLYDYGLQKTASLQSAYIASFDREGFTNEGLIPLFGLQSSVKGRRDEENLRLDEVTKNSEDELVERHLVSIPAIGVQNVIGATKLFYSFFNILASIGDILQFKEEKEMQNEFIRKAQLREYPLFYNSNNFVQDTSEYETTDEDAEKTSDESIKNFIHDLWEWKEGWNKITEKIVIQPYLFGRIMVRTRYSFSRVSIKAQKSAGELMHRYMVIFLNAILVEEVMENEGNSKLTLQNPSNADGNFIKNYNNNKDSTHPFFDFFFRCPMIAAYINPKLYDSLNSSHPKRNIFKTMDKLTILGDKSPILEVTSKKFNENINEDKPEHIKALIDYFRDKRISKEQLTYDNLRHAILEIFANKRAPERKKFDRIMQLVKNQL